MSNFLCEKCGKGTVEQRKVEHEANFRGIKFLIKDAVIGICNNCGAEYFDAKEFERWQQLFEVSLSNSNPPLSPSEIRTIRENLGLNQRQFSVLIGATRQSLYNWENENRRVAQSRQADLMIRLLSEWLHQPEVDVLDFLLREAKKSGIQLPKPAKSYSRNVDNRRRIRVGESTEGIDIIEKRQNLVACFGVSRKPESFTPSIRH